jgi:Fic family protein
MPVLYLSKYIITYKEDYYNHLGAVTQRGDWKPWILFMLEAVEKTSVLTEDLIHEISNQTEATLVHGKSKIKWYSKEINELIFSQPYLKSKSLGSIMGVSSGTTLTKYFLELKEAKILFPKKDGKEVYYINEELVRI